MNFRLIWVGPEDDGDGNPAARESVGAKADDRKLPAARYTIREGGIVRCEQLGKGRARFTPVANFTARIVGDVIVDDEAEPRREFTVEADLEGQRLRFAVPAADFGRMAWVLNRLGPRAIIYPGQQQHARAAIQSLSGAVPEERIATRMGWHRYGSDWVYLQGSGALGGRGVIAEAGVRLPAALERYRLQPAADARAGVDAIRASLRFLSVAPDRISLPLLAAVYRAPLGNVDFSVFLAGPSGVFKTALAALCQQHFGEEMDAAALPAHFGSTAGALEELAFAASDALLVIDDFVPVEGAGEGEVRGTAERLFRAVGNRQGRGRMGGYGRLRMPRPPRALVLATGEQVPRGRSLRARLLIIELRPGEVDRSVLSQCQTAAREGQPAAAMAAFVSWIAGRHEELQQRRQARVRELRNQASPGLSHARLPAVLAELQSGWEIWLRFAREAGALDSAEQTGLERRGSRALAEIAALQARWHLESDPPQRFLALLCSAITGGRAHVRDRTGGMPEAPSVWGWKTKPGGRKRTGSGRCIGWIAGSELYLDSSASYQIALREAGADRLALSEQMLRGRLRRQGLLASVDSGRQTLLVRRILEGSPRHVLHLRAADFAGVGRDSSTVPAPQPEFAASAVLLAVFCGALFAQNERQEMPIDPFFGKPEAIAAGAALYNQNCAVCHGPEARGERGPSLVSGSFSHGGADGELLVTIRGGVRGTQMPPFPQLSTDQIWQIVAWLRSISGNTPPSTSAASETVGGDPAAGKTVFEGKGGCLDCHRIDGTGKAAGPDLSAAGGMPARQLLTKITDPNSMIFVRAGGPGRGGPLPPATVVVRIKGGKEYRGARKNADSLTVSMIDTAGIYRTFDKSAADVRVDNVSLMPADYAKRLSAAEIQNVVAYLKTLDGKDPSRLATGADVLTWDRLRNSGKEPQNYMTYWGDLAGRHYSALTQINTANVKTLQAKWALPLPGSGNTEGVPLAVDGILYTVGTAAGTLEVLAADASTGRPLWRYRRPQKIINPTEINQTNRGVAVMGNRVFFGTLDAALVALDARTGTELWETFIADTMKGYSITSAPIPVRNMIITGITGGDMGGQGFLEAYDQATGKKLWRFNTLPQPGEAGHETWKGDSWQRGGAPTWLTGTYDAESDTLYWPVGNPGPDFDPDIRQGDDLYSCSVIALDPNTGRLKWHYQFTPNDSHDWDSTEDMMLVDRVWHGENRKLILHADRNGIFYVLDRTNGKFLAGNPFVRATWVKSWDENGRPILADNWNSTPEGNFVYPGIGGGTNFQAPSYSAQTGWAYFAYHDGGQLYASAPEKYDAGKMYMGRGTGVARQQPAGSAPSSDGIQAFDPETGKTQWKFVLSQGGVSPGVLATGGGLLFAATSEGNFIALDAKTGRPLWHFTTGVRMESSPVSYSVDGRQYIAITSAGMLYAFALPE